MIYVWTFFLLFGVVIDAKQCPRVCGRVENVLEQDRRGNKNRSAKSINKNRLKKSWQNDDFEFNKRIINGWDVTDRYGNTGCGVFRVGYKVSKVFG